MDYLTNMPTDMINEHGLQKTLFTRRETIYLKHIMKNMFTYGNESDIEAKVQEMQFKSVFRYMQFLTNKLRGIYKFERYFDVPDADAIVKTGRDSICTTLDLYEPLKPLVIIDFDKTITNKKFHSLYQWIAQRFKIVINSANPDKDSIQKYLQKHDLPLPYAIYANKGKKKKIVKLKVIASQNIYNPVFYIDDETEYLEYGVMLGMYCYQYRKTGKIYNYTIFQK